MSKRRLNQILKLFSKLVGVTCDMYKSSEEKQDVNGFSIKVMSKKGQVVSHSDRKEACVFIHS